MHFKNKRPAQNGDPVIAKSYQGKVVVGSIFNLNPGSETCNCDVAVIVPGGTQVLTCQTVGQLFHAEDALAAVEAANQPPRESESSLLRRVARLARSSQTRPAVAR